MKELNIYSIIFTEWLNISYLNYRPLSLDDDKNIKM